MYHVVVTVARVALLTSCSAFAFGNWKISFSQRLQRIRCRESLQCSAKRKGAYGRTKKKAAGFGSEVEENKAEPESGTIYSLPALYDLAFGYRGFQEEVDFLLYAHEIHGGSGTQPTSVVELAAGPARHAIESLLLEDTPVLSATALDLSKEMVQYGTDLANSQLNDAQRNSFQYLCGDMRGYEFSSTFDTAWILLGSLQHMVSNQDVLACFRAVHTALKAGGTVIVELPHPRETFTMVECTRNGWTVPLEDERGENYGELQVVWGDEDDPFDPITQVRNFTVSMQIVAPEPVEGMQSVREIVPMRKFTAQEINLLAASSGFEVAAMYGALDEEVSIDDEDGAFRLVCVLRKN